MNVCCESIAFIIFNVYNCTSVGNQILQENQVGVAIKKHIPFYIYIYQDKQLQSVRTEKFHFRFFGQKYKLRFLTSSSNDEFNWLKGKKKEEEPILIFCKTEDDILQNE